MKESFYEIRAPFTFFIAIFEGRSDYPSGFNTLCSNDLCRIILLGVVVTSINIYFRRETLALVHDCLAYNTLLGVVISLLTPK